MFGKVNVYCLQLDVPYRERIRARFLISRTSMLQEALLLWSRTDNLSNNYMSMINVETPFKYPHRICNKYFFLNLILLIYNMYSSNTATINAHASASKMQIYIHQGIWPAYCASSPLHEMLIPVIRYSASYC
jgi:hypothetical protein